MSRTHSRSTETCARCGREAYTLTAEGELVCRAHDPQSGRNYTCTEQGCEQPLHPDSEEVCVLHI